MCKTIELQRQNNPFAKTSYVFIIKSISISRTVVVKLTSLHERRCLISSGFEGRMKNQALGDKVKKEEKEYG